MTESSRTVVGNVTDSHYYEEFKKIRSVVLLPDGHTIRVEIPDTRFTFRPGMDVDEEMRKLSSLLVGKNIKVMYSPEA